MRIEELAAYSEAYGLWTDLENLWDQLDIYEQQRVVVVEVEEMTELAEQLGECLNALGSILVHRMENGLYVTLIPCMELDCYIDVRSEKKLSDQEIDHYIATLV